MLDLKELERRLDEALAKETKESLNSWLYNQRKDSFENYLGAGFIKLLQKNSSTFKHGLPQPTVYNCTNDETNPSVKLSQAA